MLRRVFSTTLLVALVFLVGAATVARAQSGKARGKIEIKKADGTTTLAVGITVEAYRVDVKTKLPATKTDSRGEFLFTTLVSGGQYALAISGPGIRPQIFPGIKAGDEKITISVDEGNGQAITEEQARQAIDASVPAGKNGELTAEQKKAQAELEKQAAEINARNAKTQSNDALIKKAGEEANAAFKAKNYDLAIAKFEEGYQVEPTYVGSAPVLLNNKALALKNRAIDLYNLNRATTDVNVKIQTTTKVTKDFADAVDAYSTAWTVLKNSPVADRGDGKNYEANKMVTLTGIKDLIKVMVQTEKVEPTKTDAIKTLVQEYIAVEKDQAAKTDAQVALADVYRIGGDATNAIAEYRKALEISPDNPDALAGLGLSLFDAGERSGDVKQKQEGLNYMQRFTEVAPANHKLKESVTGAVEYLKSQKLAPEKTGKSSTKKKQ